MVSMAFVPAGCEAFTDDDQFDGFDFGDEQGYNYHEKDPPRVQMTLLDLTIS